MNENPTVNRYLRDKAMDHIDHALGRPVWPLRESYRNYFAADSASAMDFDASPYWELRNSTPFDVVYYSVTDNGRRALAEHLAGLDQKWRAYVVSFDDWSVVVPALNRHKAKYACFLRLTDTQPSLSFKTFALYSRVRLAA